MVKKESFPELPTERGETRDQAKRKSQSSAGDDPAATPESKAKRAATKSRAKQARTKKKNAARVATISETSGKTKRVRRTPRATETVNAIPTDDQLESELARSAVTGLARLGPVNLRAYVTGRTVARVARGGGRVGL